MKPELNANDLAKIRGSSEWPLVKRYIDEKMEKAQALLEDSIDIDQTNLERGKIRAYRQMLRDIEQDLTNHPAQPVPYGQ